MDIEFSFHNDLSYLKVYSVKKKEFRFCECLITACRRSSSHIAQKESPETIVDMAC